MTLLGVVLAVGGIITFGYFWYQAHYNFRFSLAILLSSALLGLLLFAVGFSLLLNRFLQVCR
jgi:hypothetical protein